MVKRINEEFWLNEDTPAFGGQPDPGAGGPPASLPGSPGDPMATGANSNMPPQGGPDISQTPQPKPPEDLSNDPQYPEMPEDQDDQQDFETWRVQYMKESAKGDPHVLEDLILKIRDQAIEGYPHKFVEDNLAICHAREHQDILIPSGKIRKNIKDNLDQNLPATSLITQITTVLEENPLVKQMYIKCMGGMGGKQDIHRKLIAALLGAVQVGSGASNEDLIYRMDDVEIKISTRFASKWGDVAVGAWSLKEDDPQRYLKEVELNRLESGSPEEKDVLRRRVVMESISEYFLQRAFIINVVSTDGTIQHVGLDLGNCLKAAYTDGKLVVRTKSSDSLDAFIDEEGQIVPIPELSIQYVKDSDHTEGDGKPAVEELEFMSYRHGTLYLTATVDLIKEASSTLSGLVYKESPYQGNPTDLLRISRSVPSLSEFLLSDRG